MHQVTAIFQDSEIGYGEGEKFDYAVEECLDSMPSIFSMSIFNDEISTDDVELLILDAEGNKRKMTLREFMSNNATA
jgi:hypothetical protein